MAFLCCSLARARTAQRAGEPAWHRRQRRARGNARALVRVAAAARLLEQHHSSQTRGYPMPNASKGKGANSGKGGGGGGGGGKSGNGVNGSRAQPGDWACHICGVQANRDWRERCRNCSAYRSVEMERVFADHAQRQSQQQRRSNQQQQQQRQQQQRLQDKQNDDDRRSLRQQLEKLQSELAAVKSQQQLQSTGGADEDGDDEMADDNGYSSWTADERAKRLDLAKGALAYATARYGEESAQAQDHRDEIAALQKACREAKPFKSHRNMLERRRDDLRRRQERDEATISATKDEIATLQDKLSTLQATVEDRTKQLKQINEELSVIVRKALEEEGAGEADEDGKPPCGQTCAPWSALATAAKGLAGQPGMPNEIATLLAQVQQVASAFSANAVTARANPGGVDPQPAAAAAADNPPHTDGKPRVTSPPNPVVLAPHGRFGRTATSTKSTPPTPPRPQPATPTTTTDTNGGGGAEGGTATTGGEGTSAVGGVGREATATTGEGKGHDGSDAELLEDDADGGGTAPMDIEVSISKLPDVDQRRIREAIRRGGATRGQRRGDEGGNAGDEEEGRRERERSPRPNKHTDKDL